MTRTHHLGPEKINKDTVGAISQVREPYRHLLHKTSKLSVTVVKCFWIMLKL